MKAYKMLLLSLMIVGMMVVGGCQSAEPAPVDSADPAAAETTGAEVGRGDFPGLSDSNLLAMGTMELEGTGDAVTPEQAAKLLPLWTVIQSGALQGTAETDAVIKQIRGQMTEAQLAAIDAMALTQEDTQTWLRDQGMEQPGGGDDGQAPAGRPGGLGDMSEEDRAAMREKFQSMTEDERATAMADMGFERPEGGAAGGFGGGRGANGGNPILQPLIDLLTARAAE